MSKIIYMTKEYADECRRDFEKALSTAKLADGKISFTKTFSIEKRKATVYFTPEAWAKMFCLLQEFSDEVAWHGVANRMDTDGKDEYLITDILVYPQEVSGTTVEMDTEKYAVWLQENDEDERFYNIHMQGHSHVNMAPNPSGVDLNHQEEILVQLGNEDFYIFMIYNKSLKRNIKVYDLQKNVLFEDGDVDVKIFGGTVGFDEFIAGAKEMVKRKTYTYQCNRSPAASTTPASTRPYNPLNTANQTTPNAGNGKDKKGAADEKPKTQIGAGWHGANACDQQAIGGWDDDYTNPYSAFGYRGY